jgi:hypothetical protein
LSSDAAPELVRLFHSAELPGAVRDQAGAALACMAAFHTPGERRPAGAEPLPAPAWQSFHFSRWQGERWLASAAAELQAYRLQRAEGFRRRWTVKTPLGETFVCDPEPDWLD